MNWLNCCRLSGQLSRRSDDIHLPRYRSEIQADVTEFVKVIQTFQHHLPLAQESALDQWYEYLLEYSIGCVGILKTWLIRALRNALIEDAKTLTRKHLQQSEYSAARRQQLREEAEAGETPFYRRISHWSWVLMILPQAKYPLFVKGVWANEIRSEIRWG